MRPWLWSTSWLELCFRLIQRHHVEKEFIPACFGDTIPRRSTGSDVVQALENAVLVYTYFISITKTTF